MCKKKEGWHFVADQGQRVSPLVREVAIMLLLTPLPLVSGEPPLQAVNGEEEASSCQVGVGVDEMLH